MLSAKSTLSIYPIFLFTDNRFNEYFSSGFFDVTIDYAASDHRYRSLSDGLLSTDQNTDQICIEEYSVWFYRMVNIGLPYRIEIDFVLATCEQDILIASHFFSAFY